MDQLTLIAAMMETRGLILPIAYTGPRIISFPLHEIVIVNNYVADQVTYSFVGATAPHIAPILCDKLMWGP